MANSYSPIDFRLNSETQVLTSAGTQLASKEIPLTAGGSQVFRVDVKVSSVNLNTGIILKLQHRSIDEWSDLAGANATVDVTADGEYSLTQLIYRAADQANMPLKKQIRVLIVLGGGDEVTIDAVKVSQPQ